MRMCGRLADLGMQLAEHAAARALAAGLDPEDERPPAEPPCTTTAEPPCTTTAEPPSTTIAETPPTPTADPPCLAPAAPARTATAEPSAEAEIAEIDAILRRARLWLRTPGCKAIDPALLFTRLAATVRDCIALEARLAAGLIPGITAPRRAANAGPPRASDPRRAFLDEAFEFITKTHPDRTALRRQAAALADGALPADPSEPIDLHLLLFTICDELDVEVDFAHLPDKYLGLADDPPDPRATSPP